MNNSKSERHSYLCKFPLAHWHFLVENASNKGLTVASYINQLVYDERMRCLYGNGGLFPISEKKDESISAGSSDDLFEKKVGDVVNSKEYGRGVIRTVNNKRKFFEVHFFSCDEIAPDAVQLFRFEDFNADNFLINWCESYD